MQNIGFSLNLYCFWRLLPDLCLVLCLRPTACCLDRVMHVWDFDPLWWPTCQMHFETHGAAHIIRKSKAPIYIYRHIHTVSIYFTSSDSAVVTISDVFTEAIEHSGIGDWSIALNQVTSTHFESRIFKGLWMPCQVDLWLLCGFPIDAPCKALWLLQRCVATVL